MRNKFYITTTLPYVNSTPHIGFAMEIIQADVLARFHRELGEEVFFNTGADEHGTKILEKAQEKGMTPQEYADSVVGEFQNLKSLLNLSFDNFIRTTDEHHVKAAQEFWRICDKNDFIYKKKYKVKYCTGCEMEKTDSELEKGCCPLHPDKELEIIEEENYFFKYSEFQEKLLKLYKDKPELVVPAKRFNEIKAFVERGLNDFSISRLKEKMPWGVPVPGDETQVMYVWFDALVNYISAIGWPEDSEKFNSFHPAVQICGKDNLRPQSGMWQAMLMAAGIKNSDRIYVNGFINVDGQKMSKSLGNVISPKEMVEKFGVDGTRYLLLTSGVFGEDWDVSWEKFTEKYNADLANGLGNLTSRVIKLAENFQFPISLAMPDLAKPDNFQTIFNDEIIKLFDGLNLSSALDEIWKIIREDDKYIDENKPWELKKNNPEKFKEVIEKLLKDVALISEMLKPFLPETSEKIKRALENREIKPLFQRIK